VQAAHGRGCLLGPCVDIDQADIRAVRSERKRDCTADAARSAGDKSDPAVETHREPPFICNS
jgi:hypothetical protein